MVRRLLAGLLLVVLLAGGVLIPVDAAEISADYMDTKTIYSYSDVPLDINPDGNGNLIISDNGYVIWKINPLNGTYTIYDVGINPVSDAQGVPSPTEGYWFTNNVDQISFTDLSNIFSWVIPVEAGQVGQSVGQIAIDPAGAVWAIESFSTKSKVYKITRNLKVATICRLIPNSGGTDYGTWAYDMILRDNYLWWFNWSEDQIVRMNITQDVQGKFTMEQWDTGISMGAIEGRVIDFDQAGNLWIPGGGAGKIYQFNPTTQVLRTFSIPGTTSIEGVTAFGWTIWYADSKGSVGILNPLAAPSVSSDLASNYQSDQLVISLPCDGVDAIETNIFATTSGMFDLTHPQSITLDTTHPGLTIVPLAPDDALTGINNAQGVIMVSNQKGPEPHTGQLIRFIPPPVIEYKVFLPLIRR